MTPDGELVRRIEPKPAGRVPVSKATLSWLRHALRTVTEVGTGYGFQTALGQPDQYSKGVSSDTLPAAGPERARALWMWLAFKRVSRKGGVSVRMSCPARWPGREAKPTQHRLRECLLEPFAPVREHF